MVPPLQLPNAMSFLHMPAQFAVQYLGPHANALFAMLCCFRRCLCAIRPGPTGPHGAPTLSRLSLQLHCDTYAVTRGRPFNHPCQVTPRCLCNRRKRFADVRSGPLRPLHAERGSHESSSKWDQNPGGASSTPRPRLPPSGPPVFAASFDHRSIIFFKRNTDPVNPSIPPVSPCRKLVDRV